MANWEHMKRYRFRALQQEAQIEKNAKTGTMSAQIICEATTGEQLGQRLRWRGYLNSPANQQTAIAEMRVMGWKGTRLGDWSGLGSKEFEATAVSEVGDDKKTYWRLAWPRPLATVNADKAVKADELAALNAALGDVLATTTTAPKLGPVPQPVEGDEQGDLDFPV